MYCWFSVKTGSCASESTYKGTAGPTGRNASAMGRNINERAMGRGVHLLCTVWAWMRCSHALPCCGMIFYAMLCYVLLCWYAMLCYVMHMLWYNTQCYVTYTEHRTLNTDHWTQKQLVQSSRGNGYKRKATRSIIPRAVPSHKATRSIIPRKRVQA